MAVRFSGTSQGVGLLLRCLSIWKISGIFKRVSSFPTKRNPCYIVFETFSDLSGFFDISPNAKIIASQKFIFFHFPPQGLVAWVIDEFWLSSYHRTCGWFLYSKFNDLAGGFIFEKSFIFGKGLDEKIMSSSFPYGSHHKNVFAVVRRIF